MIADLPSIGAGALASRLRSEIGTGTWLCVLSPSARPDAVVAEISEALEAGGTFATVVPLDGTARPLVEAAPRKEVLVVSGFETLSEEEWMHLDLLRSSRLVRDQPALLVMAPASMERLIRLAPNMASFVGGQFLMYHEAIAQLTEAERSARLERLRSKLGKTDEQVIEMAASGAPLDEPAYAEWLVLLGRGDLVPR